MGRPAGAAADARRVADGSPRMAAGLIAKPEKPGCTAKCHKPAEFKDEMLGRVHDRKK